MKLAVFSYCDTGTEFKFFIPIILNKLKVIFIK